MKIAKLHELIQMAKEGHVFRATNDDAIRWIHSKTFLKKLEWNHNQITIDWKYEYEPSVLSFELRVTNDGHLELAEVVLKKLQGKKWHIVAQENIEGD